MSNSPGIKNNWTACAGKNTVLTIMKHLNMTSMLQKINNWKNYTIEPVYRAILDNVGDRIVLLKQEHFFTSDTHLNSFFETVSYI